MFESLRFWTLLKEATSAVSLYRRCAADPRTPKTAKWLLVGALAYLASPIDLIPDWIPIIGELDDIVIVSGMIMLARRLIPKEVLDEQRERVKAEEVKALAIETADRKK